MGQYKTYSALVKGITKSVELAVQETAEEARDVLEKCIKDQYYDDPEFYPSVYDRTKTFLNSAAMEMLFSGNGANIYVDLEGMHYKNGFSPLQVVTWASESKHGADYFQTKTKDFWTKYIEWCNKNLANLLKANLRKHGVNVK